MTSIAEYDYALPEELIAQAPAAARDGSRLLLLDRSTGGFAHRVFRDLPDFLRKGDLLILNNTRVIPSRIVGKRTTGGRVKVLLVRRDEDRRWTALLDSSRRLKVGERLHFAGGPDGVIVGKGEEGKWLLEFEGDVESYMMQRGEPPLPPYIRRKEGVRPEDGERYQTVYAARDGAIAAPTAGLHFTPELLERIRVGGVTVADVTLHVGIGTFKPIKAETIEEHRMENEEYEIPDATIGAIERTRREGGRIVAVGTTSCRTVETFARTGARRGWTDIYIRPPFEFRLTDALITNFHLPKSTLMLLVSAFAGREQIFRAYAEAIRERYRFYSYGDAMFIC